MTDHPDDRIALFIDGANLYSAARALNCDLDFKKLSQRFTGEGRLIRTYYYTAVIEGEILADPPLWSTGSTTMASPS